MCSLWKSLFHLASVVCFNVVYTISQAERVYMFNTQKSRFSRIAHPHNHLLVSISLWFWHWFKHLAWRVGGQKFPIIGINSTTESTELTCTIHIIFTPVRAAVPSWLHGWRAGRQWRCPPLRLQHRITSYAAALAISTWDRLFNSARVVHVRLRKFYKPRPQSWLAPPIP